MSASFVLAGITALVVWVAVAGLLGRGRLETVLSAGRAMRWGEPAWMAGRSRSSRTRGPGRP